MLRKLINVTACLLTFSYAIFIAPSSSQTAVAASPANFFYSERVAQSYGPRGIVVCLNSPTGFYHYRGEVWYGRTKHDAFICENEAISARGRARASENWQ